MDASVVRKEAKKHGARKRIEGLAEKRTVDVVVVEDVATTGGPAAAEWIERNLECPFDRIFRLSEL